MNPDPSDPAEVNPSGLAARQYDQLVSNQFSMQALMIATAVIAALCCLFFTLPGWLGAIVLLILILLSMPAMLAALIYGTGRMRAFALGTMPPITIIFFWLAGFGSGGLRFFASGFRGMDGEWGTRIVFAVLTFVIIASGFVAQAVRWWILRRSPNGLTRD